MKFRRLKDQVVVIMGASSGIGRVTARRFAAKGARVILASRNLSALKDLADDIKAEGGQALAVEADVTEFSQVERVGQKAVNAFGRLDTWVHASAVSLYSPFIDVSPEELKQVVETNLVGAGYGALVALPLLKRFGGGALIEISSVESHVGTPYTSIYAASKHGVRGMLDVIRMEVKEARLPISVTNIMPHGINTPFFNHALTKIGVKPRPAPPAYDPNLVADAILHAATHETPEIVVGGAGKLFIASKRYAPALTDWMVRKTAFRAQRSSERRSADAPNNLRRPHSDVRERGDFDTISRHSSAQVWGATHPFTSKLAVLALLGGAAVFFLGKRRDSSRPDPLASSRSLEALPSAGATGSEDRVPAGPQVTVAAGI